MKRFRSDRSGATAIEYALIAAFIALIIVTAVGALGQQLSSTFTQVSNLFG